MYEDAMELLRNERMRTEELTRVIVNLKVSGAQLQRDPSAPKPAPRTPSDFEIAVDQNRSARNNPRLRSHLLTWGEKEVRGGADRAKVLATIKGWDRVTDEDDTDDDDEMIAIG